MFSTRYQLKLEQSRVTKRARLRRRGAALRASPLRRAHSRRPAARLDASEPSRKHKPRGAYQQQAPLRE